MSKINFPKKQEQRLIPKYLLEYAEELQENHPDPSAEWGGGDDITAGTGITITTESDDTKTISIDETVVATKDEIPDEVSGTNDGTNWTSLTIGEDTYGLASGGSTYTAGTGIDITNDIISVDTSTVAMKTDIPTNYVTTNTDQNITGEKKFRGDRRIKFQQSVSGDKLGFTGYDYSGNEIGNLQQQKLSLSPYYYPSTSWDKWLTSIGDYATDRDSLVGFRTRTTLGTNQQINFIAPHITYSEFESVYVPGFDTYFLPIVFTDGVGRVFADKTGKVNIGGLIPSVNNNTITIQENGTTVDTFRLNQSTDKTINISVPTKTSDLTNDRFVRYDTSSQGLTTTQKSNARTNIGAGTSNFSGSYNDLSNKPTIPTATSDLNNDSGFITGINSSDVITALGYTPGTSNFDGDYNSLTNKPTIPTATSDLTNDSGFITGINSSDVTTALGFTPYSSANPDGYITGITSGDVTTALGYTPTNPSSLATVATTGAYSDLIGTPTIPTTTSQLNNDSGFITNTVNNLTNYTLSSNLATVATSGSYNDLTNKPNTPTQTVIYDCGDSTGVQTNVTWSTDIFANFDYIHIYYRSTDGAINTYVIPTDVRPANDIPCALSATQVTTAGANYNKNDVWYLKSDGLGINHTARYNQIAVSTGNVVTLEHTEFIYLLKIVGYKNAGYFSAVAWNDITGKPAVATTDNIYYKNGDTFTNIAVFSITGAIKNSSKTIDFTITVPKSLSSISSITVDKCNAFLFGVGGAVNGTNYIDYATATGYTITATKASENMITISIVKSSAYSSATNNTPINVQFSLGGLELTFNT